jgi:hypothetical protein
VILWREQSPVQENVCFTTAETFVKIDNISFERVEEFKYLGTTLTSQNSIQEEVKRRLKSGNACYYSVQNLLSSRLLSKNLKTWSSANNSIDSCLFFESLIPVMCCFCHLVIISSKYILNNVGERGQPWHTPLLISVVCCCYH